MPYIVIIFLCTVVSSAFGWGFWTGLLIAGALFTGWLFLLAFFLLLETLKNLMEWLK